MLLSESIDSKNVSIVLSVEGNSGDLSLFSIAWAESHTACVNAFSFSSENKNRGVLEQATRRVLWFRIEGPCTGGLLSIRIQN